MVPYLGLWSAVRGGQICPWPPGAESGFAPRLVHQRAGWAIVKRDEFNVDEGKALGLVYHPRGLHGYDHEHPLMRAIFVARGPAFPHAGNSKVEVFRTSPIFI